ncbi:MAG: 2-amino-4-hydroxy-6-hydroxymethyldihydropteridine diphosphokinase [Bacteroidetes bacterium]|nr:2-amino-4-hydroxy-6-hydroxymethyldihydropteridine diphosphokinase [Bacteroidota bacterium]
MKRAIISLGSNLGDRLSNLEEALWLISLEGVYNLRCSSVYSSDPQGFESENKFLNMVAVFYSALQADEILKLLLEVETRMGRVRIGKSYSDRKIDLDLLDVEGITIQGQELTLPHPRMHQRDFVLIPLLEVCPDWVHPVLKHNIDRFLGELPPGFFLQKAHNPLC